jgi:hypothetical protein
MDVVWVFQCQGVAVDLDIGINTQHPSDRYNGLYFIRLTRHPDDGSRQEPKHVGVIRIIIN